MERCRIMDDMVLTFKELMIKTKYNAKIYLHTNIEI